MLLLVGDGPDRNAIERRAGALGIAPRVKLLGRRADVAGLLGLADLYVHYATAENCPMAIIESAAAGLPWAAVPAAGVEELQRLIGGCIAIDPHDITHATDAILSILNDPPRRARLGAAARRRFHDGFTGQSMVRSYLRLLGDAGRIGPIAEGAA